VGRLNAITVVVHLAAAMTIGAVVLVATRPRIRSTTEPALSTPAESPRAESAPTAEAASPLLVEEAPSVGGAPRRVETRRLPSLVALPREEQPGEAGTGLATSLRASQIRTAAVRRQQLLAQADEKALDAVGAAEPVRSAVREINGKFGKEIESLINQSANVLAPAPSGPHSGWTTAEAARRVAIDGLFDRETAKKFHHFERVALGSHYRRRWSPVLTAGTNLPPAPAADGTPPVPP